MHPIVTALVTNPAVATAAKNAAVELLPYLKQGIRFVRPRSLVLLAPTVLVSCFAAGVAVGWLTAPRRGAVLRRKLREKAERAVQRFSKSAKKQKRKALGWKERRRDAKRRGGSVLALRSM